MRERGCSTSCANLSNDSDSTTPVGSVSSELGTDSRAGSTACSLPGAATPRSASQNCHQRRPDGRTYERPTYQLYSLAIELGEWP